MLNLCIKQVFFFFCDQRPKLWRVPSQWDNIIWFLRTVCELHTAVVWVFHGISQSTIFSFCLFCRDIASFCVIFYSLVVIAISRAQVREVLSIDSADVTYRQHTAGDENSKRTLHFIFEICWEVIRSHTMEAYSIIQGGCDGSPANPGFCAT